jgi:hypothetical protein
MYYVIMLHYPKCTGSLSYLWTILLIPYQFSRAVTLRDHKFFIFTLFTVMVFAAEYLPPPVWTNYHLNVSKFCYKTRHYCTCMKKLIPCYQSLIVASFAVIKLRMSSYYTGTSTMKSHNSMCLKEQTKDMITYDC